MSIVLSIGYAAAVGAADAPRPPPAESGKSAETSGKAEPLRNATAGQSAAKPKPAAESATDEPQCD